MEDEDTEIEHCAVNRKMQKGVQFARCGLDCSGKEKEQARKRERERVRLKER